jgi:hypothetical protein
MASFVRIRWETDSEALEPRDVNRVLVDCLSRGLSYSEAGKKAGVSERTVSRRMGDPNFRGQVAEGLRGAVADGSRRLVAAVPDAIDVLGELRGEKASARPGASTRLKACLGTIELAHKLATEQSLLTEVLRRLDRLEQEREP